MGRSARNFLLRPKFGQRRRGQAMLPAVIAAKIAALASISAAIISALVAWFSARRSAGEQRKLELLRGGAQRDLEELKAQLAVGAAEKSARRAYEFEALK